MKRFPFKNGDRIVFQGDSITDSGWRNDQHKLGDGYVAIIKGFLGTMAPDRKIEVINRGISGDRSVDLLLRWEKDVLDLKPTHLSVMIGVNDIWRRFDGCVEKAIALPDYKTNYRRLIEDALDSGIKHLILMTPTTVNADPQDESNVMCAEYAAEVEAFAKEFDAILVPARDRMWKAVEGGPSVDFWLPDGVHPSIAGHCVLAEAWLEAVGVI